MFLEPKKECPKRNNDARHGRSLMSFTIRDVGCGRHDKRKTIMWSSAPQKEQRGDWGIVKSSHDKKGGNLKRMNGAGKGNSCGEMHLTIITNS